MPKILGFSCKSPVAVAELDLYCQTEGEQRQPAKSTPSLGSPEVLWCAALHMLSSLSTPRNTAVGLPASTPVYQHDALLEMLCDTSAMS